MNKDKWMTEFYGIDWYKINSIEELENVDGESLVECVINVDKYKEVYELQKEGFHIVETAIEFETLIDHIDITKQPIRVSTENDLDDILYITKESYLTHNKFYNRFRNRDFFSEEKSWEYYKNSVINSFSDEDSLTVVVDDEEGVCAYYIIKKVGELELYHKYKGIISGVHKRAKGRDLHIEMQKKITEIIGTPYITNNRTQLGNYRVINNHLRERRQLSKIEHIMYKKFG
jgi:hypothetical protein